MASHSSSDRSLMIQYLFIFLMISAPSTEALSTSEGRSLLSFKETPKGGNATFDCSPSGPCLSCPYSEKIDDKYRCSETGYHIPLKCVVIKGGSKVEKKKKERSTEEISNKNDGEEHSTSIGNRKLLDDSATLDSINQPYITYRSCIPAVFEEKLSVFGFEAIMLGLLLASGPVVYFRRKRTIAMSGVGPVRVQTNSRF